MSKLNQNVSRCVARWRTDLRELASGITQDPFAQGRGRRWDRDFTGEIGPADIHYSVFLTVLSLIPAAVVAYVAPVPDWMALANFLKVPLQVAISGFLTSVLVFAGSHFNKVPRPFSVAFKAMLRIMAIYPLLRFFTLFKFGEPILLLFYGFFVVRGVIKTYAIPLRNAVLFFGVIFFCFAVMQLQQIVSPPTAEKYQDYFKRPDDPGHSSNSLPPSRAIVRTSSSKTTPH